MAVDGETFRQVLGSWATGVTIVTSQHGDVRHGMTVSAFNEVSLDPPLVLVCADKSSNTMGVIEQSGAFSVSILARGQDELSNLFANKQKEAIRFNGLDCTLGVTGCPRIPKLPTMLSEEVSRLGLEPPKTPPPEHRRWVETGVNHNSFGRPVDGQSLAT